MLSCIHSSVETPNDDVAARALLTEVFELIVAAGASRQALTQSLEAIEWGLAFVAYYETTQPPVFRHLRETCGVLALLSCFTREVR